MACVLCRKKKKSSKLRVMDFGVSNQGNITEIQKTVFGRYDILLGLAA